MKKYHKFFYDRNIPVDVIPARAGFEGYKVLILPQMIVTDPGLQRRVKDFVRQGGIALLTYRDFVKDQNNNLVLGKQLPAGLCRLRGGLRGGDREPAGGPELPPGRGRGVVPAPGARAAFSGTCWKPGTPRCCCAIRTPSMGNSRPLTRKAQEKGWVYYLGCGADEALLARLLGEICERQGIAGETTVPGVEVVYRGVGKDRIRLVLNHNAQRAEYRGQALEPFQCLITPAAE